MKVHPFTGLRLTIATKRSFAETDAALRAAVKFDESFDHATPWGSGTADAFAAIKANDKKAYEAAVSPRFGPFGFMYVSHQG